MIFHWYSSHPKHELKLLPEDIPLDIVYEDDYLVVVNKPAGFVVHPGHGNYTGTLVNALLHHFGYLPKNEKSDVAYPGLVHRIDKDTTRFAGDCQKRKMCFLTSQRNFSIEPPSATYYAIALGKH